ncbi:MAG: Cys-tRNA(Pro) deacylase [Clostridiales bacterium]|nr:Cys-tRNA(Pro) deacylase [Clostridiales bacterium]
MPHKNKTNAVRILERAGIAYQCIEYAHEEGVAADGKTVAAMLGQDEASVFKTLVTVGSSREHYVFVVPVAKELDLKAAARAVGEKSVEMVQVSELLKLTGYVRGGCSPVGMKKPYPTVIDASARERECIYVSAGKIGLQVRLAPKALADLIGGFFAEIAH